MTFSNKLDFLMNLVPVRNVELARVMHIDASQISRLRSGARGTPQKSDLIRSMARYFASKCSGDYQRAALSERLGNIRARLATSAEELTGILFGWLSDDGYEDAPVPGVAHGMPDSVTVSVAASSPEAEHARSFDNESVMVYFGNEGKRNAIRELYSRIKGAHTPVELLISGDESNEWLTEDAAFHKEVKQELLALAESGTRIKRIIPPQLNINEVFDSFSIWLPAYLTGSVQPVYLPRLRDGLYRRTTIVVPGIAALSSTSIGKQKQSGVTYLFSTPSLVEAKVRDFEMYRDMCLNAIAIYDPITQYENLRNRLLKYYNSSAPAIQIGGGLSFMSMPRQIKLGLLERTGSPLMRMLCGMFADNTIPDEQTFFKRPLIDIIATATPQEVRAGEVKYCFDDDAAYTLSEYRRHIQGIAQLMERHDTYNVTISNRYQPGCFAYAKKDVGALLIQTRPPYRVIDVAAPDTYLGLWEYLNRIASSEVSAEVVKQQTLEHLRGLVMRLDEA